MSNKIAARAALAIIGALMLWVLVLGVIERNFGAMLTASIGGMAALIWLIVWLVDLADL